MAISVRPTNLEADLPRIAEIMSLCDPAPVTPAQLHRLNQHLRHGQVRASHVAISGNGQVVGFTTVHHGLWMAPGRFFLWVAVDPSAQCQGIGAHLYGRSLAFALANGARLIDTEIRDQDGSSLHFAEHRGFTLPAHLVQQQDGLHHAAPGSVAPAPSPIAGYELRPGRHRLTKQLARPRT